MMRSFSIFYLNSLKFEKNWINNFRGTFWTLSAVYDEAFWRTVYMHSWKVLSHALFTTSKKESDMYYQKQNLV